MIRSECHLLRRGEFVGKRKKGIEFLNEDWNQESNFPFMTFSAASKADGLKRMRVARIKAMIKSIWKSMLSYSNCGLCFLGTLITSHQVMLMMSSSGCLLSCVPWMLVHYSEMPIMIVGRKCRSNSVLLLCGFLNYNSSLIF